MEEDIHRSMNGILHRTQKQAPHRALTDFDKGTEVIQRKDSLFSTNGARTIQ